MNDTYHHVILYRSLALEQKAFGLYLPYLLKVMNCGAFSTSALVTTVTHLDMEAWLIPIISPMDVWNEPDV